VAENLFVVLVGKMSCNGRVPIIQPIVCLLDFFLVGQNERILLGIDESGLKKEIPKHIQIDTIAHVAVFVFRVVQQGQQFVVVFGRNVQKGETAFDPAAGVRTAQGASINHLYLTGKSEASSEIDLHLGQNHAGQKNGIRIVFLYRETGSGNVDHIPVNEYAGEGMA